MKKFHLLVLTFLLMAPIISITCANITHSDSSYTARSVNINLPKYFYKRFEGTINNKMNIVLNLIRRDTLLTGTYYYETGGKTITFTFNSRISDDGSIYLGEDTGQYDTNYIPVVSGEFKGKFINEHAIMGSWRKPGTPINYYFALVERYPAGSVNLELKEYAKNYYYNKQTNAQINFNIIQIANYPDKSIEDSINYYISNSFIKNYVFQDSSKSITNFEDIMDNFIGLYKEDLDRTTPPYGEMNKWENYYSSLILFNSNYILATENIESRYVGGAHNSAYYIYSNYNLLTGKEITLDELLKPNFKETLDKLGWRRFEETYKSPYRPHFSIDEFHLNNNFSISKLGLTFKFEEYEIGSYAFGAPEVFIPYSDLRYIIKPEGLLAQFLK